MTEPSPSGGSEPFTQAALLFTADSRCRCGAGLAYPKEGVDGKRPTSWYCAAWLLGEVELEREATPEEGAKNCPRNWIKCWAGAAWGTDGMVHDSYPFTFYDLKSENQPSAQGRTTRPTVPARD